MTARRQAARREAMLNEANAAYAAALSRKFDASRAVAAAAFNTQADVYWSAREAEMAASDALRVADAWRLRCQSALDELLEGVR